VLIAAVAVVVGLAVVSSTKMGSHVRMWLRSGKGWMARQVKPETEIKRLRMEVERLEKEDALYFDQVARQRLDVKKCEAKLQKDQSSLALLKTRITDLRALLGDAKKGDLKTVSYKDLTEVTVSDVQKQIDIDFDRYEPLEGSVESQQAYLTSLKTALAQNEKKLFGLRKARQEMLTQLQNLENELNRLKQARVAEASVLDDSSYGRVQKDIDTLKHRLEVEKEKAKLRGALGKGPIEQAQHQKEEQAEREKRLNAKFGPATPKTPVAISK
jgi:predicted  nucleic acid-binding Zn-ribbon protein